MASCSSIFYLLFILLIITQNSPIVTADEKLIQQQCHHTEVPELCEQCLLSDPTSLKSDAVGIAVNVLKCVGEHAGILRSNMSALAAASGAIDKDMKAAFKFCSDQYSAAIAKDLPKAVYCLKKKEFDKANWSITQAVTRQEACGDKIEPTEIKWRTRPGILYEMTAYQSLSEAAMRIIDRF